MAARHMMDECWRKSLCLLNPGGGLPSKSFHCCVESRIFFDDISCFSVNRFCWMAKEFHTNNLIPPQIPSTKSSSQPETRYPWDASLCFIKDWVASILVILHCRIYRDRPLQNFNWILNWFVSLFLHEFPTLHCLSWWCSRNLEQLLSHFGVAISKISESGWRPVVPHMFVKSS